jgi:nucleoside phosphorylase/NTP pyrophosphatase (non-canonical NTP hydrolase)
MSSTNHLSLDDLYHMVARIYGERNAERSASATFAHFVEVCGMLTAHDRKKRDALSIEDVLCKALGWYFPLIAKFKVSSVEDLLFRKFPYACPYCRLRTHDDEQCKIVRGTGATVDHESLKAVHDANVGLRPRSLNEWQRMFKVIYPRQTDASFGRSTLGLFEELGEMAEAVRVFDRYPKYLAGEAADVFSYLMGIANEHSLKEVREGRTFSLEDAFLQRYPGLCTQCGHQICICPVIPEATVGRLAKELDLLPLDRMFNVDPNLFARRGEEASVRALDRAGGYPAIAKHFPFDRGETNRALSILCMRLANAMEVTDPALARRLAGSAEKVAVTATQPGSREHSETAADVVALIQKLFAAAAPPINLSDDSLAGKVGRLIGHVSAGLVRFGVVTALAKEFAAMRAMLDDVRACEVAGDPNNYVLGTIPANDGSGVHHVALTLLKKMGNNSAASAASHLLRSFSNVSDVLMVGIAGGCPHPMDESRHVRLGDVVVSGSDGVVQYDNIKLGQGVVEVRGASSPPSAAMTGKINMLFADALRGVRRWEEYLERLTNVEGTARPDDGSDVSFYIGDGSTAVAHPPERGRRSGVPKVLSGRIGAANVLLKNPLLRDQLRDQLNVRAVEMEGSGIADGTWIDGRHYVLVRGISDYCDAGKNDIWQGYAAGAAAAFARALIECFSTASPG